MSSNDLLINFTLLFRPSLFEFFLATIIAFFETSTPIPLAPLISLKILNIIQPVPVPMSKICIFLFLKILITLSQSNSVSGLGISILIYKKIFTPEFFFF